MPRRPAARVPHRVVGAIAVRRLILAAAIAGLAACGDPVNAPRPGRVAWRADGSSWLAPSFDDTRAFFVGNAHDVTAVDKATGTVLWRQRTSAAGPETEGSNSVVVADIVAVGDVSVHAFDRATGAPRWIFQPSTGDWPGQFDLATDGTTIYAGTELARVYAIDARTGAQRWATAVDAGDLTAKAFNPTVAGGIVFVGVRRFTNPFTGAFVALDAATGAVLWRHEFQPDLPNGQDSGCLGRAVFFGDKAIVAADDGRIYAFDRATGAIAWVAPRLPEIDGAPSLLPGDERPLTVSGDVVVAGSRSGYITGLSAETGAELWRSTANLGSAVYPLAGDAASAYVLYVGGQLVAFDVSNGAVRWRAAPLLLGSVVVDDTHIYGGNDDALYAFRKN